MLNSKKKIEIVNVSDDLFQRIRAYSLRATPYPTAKRKVEKIGSIDINNPFDEQYDFPVISPERGQLLQTLVLNRVDVIRVKFAGADLQSLDLPSAVLSGADLFEADLSLANLSAADLSGANLSRANLSVANLKVANFSGADLRNATLGQANLSGANLTGANLNEADLFVANLSEATLQNADMLGANLTRANLAGADLSFANLSGVNFFKAQLSKTKLFRTNLTDANLADIEGIPETNEGRRSYLDYWLRSSLASSSGLDEANLPKGFMVSCTSKTKGEFGGSLCMDEGGWTITYVDQPEFAPKVDGRPAKN